jgi:lipopolysaccharide transport system ATP-binding protein
VNHRSQRRGKTTLLKIISRSPSRHGSQIEGRVASLLEVGTGFHPELTGRENVFLNGAILGMKRAEIQRKFDEIVAFAEVERFLDTPVKRYSSGMHVRLAFAVAAHLESEILVVDSAGRRGQLFRRSAWARWSQSEATAGAFRQSQHMRLLCRTGPLDGRRPLAGQCPTSSWRYFAGRGSPAVFRAREERDPGSACDTRLLYGAVVGDDGQVCSEVDISQPVNVVMRYRAAAANLRYSPNVHFYVADGSCAFVSSPRNTYRHSPGVYEAVCRIPGNFLNEGPYFVGR